MLTELAGILTVLRTTLITVTGLHRDCTCHARDTAMWGHLDDCPQRSWWHRGHRVTLTSVLPLAEFTALVRDAAAAELAARQANPGIAGGLAPGPSADGIAHRVTNALTDRHLV